MCCILRSSSSGAAHSCHTYWDIEDQLIVKNGPSAWSLPRSQLTVRDCFEGEKVVYFEGDEPAMPLSLPNDGSCQAPGNKTFFYPAKHFYESSSTQVMETQSHQNKAAPSRNISQVTDIVCHDQHTEEINNLQEEDCDIVDECKSSVSDMNSSAGEEQSA